MNSRIFIKINLLTVLLIFFIVTFIGCDSMVLKDRNNNQKEEITIEKIEKIISNYLDVLSAKDLKGLEKYGTEEYIKSYTSETLAILEKTLKSAKLVSAKINSYDKNVILVDAENLVVEENTDNKEDNNSLVAEKFKDEYVKKKGYNCIVTNSGVGGNIKLISSLTENKKNLKIFDTLKNANELSKKNGYDFSDYLGEEVYLNGFNIMDEKENIIGSAIILVKDEKIIGFWEDQAEGHDQRMVELLKY